MTSSVQESFRNFENLKFYSFESKDVLLDDPNDPDKNFYNNIQAVYRQYFSHQSFYPYMKSAT